MAEVVEAYPAEASTPERLRELPVTEVVRIERCASFATEDKLTASLGRQPPEGDRKRRRHVDGPAGPPGLRRAEHAMPERPANVNQMGREVDVVPRPVLKGREGRHESAYQFRGTGRRYSLVRTARLRPGVCRSRLRHPFPAIEHQVLGINSRFH